MTIYELVSYGLLAVTLIIATIALVLICHTRHKLVVAKENLEKKRNSSWARVQNALKKGGTSGQKPPMKSSQENGWV
jgi:cell division protein FtsL